MYLCCYGVHEKARKGFTAPGIGVADGRELTCGIQDPDLSPGSLQEP